MRRNPDAHEPEEQVDLHGLRPDDALRKLAQALHAARVRRRDRLLVITGRGWGNLDQQPVLRPRVEAWLEGAEARRLGVCGYRVAARGGALEVDLATSTDRPRREP